MLSAIHKIKEEYPRFHISIWLNYFARGFISKRRRKKDEFDFIKKLDEEEK